jgi:tRNA pseudouridine38-40 synthase
MHEAAQALVGKHDFASFQSVGSERESSVRTILGIDVAAGGAGQGRGALRPVARGLAGSPGAGDERDSLVTIEVEGDGFLYNMVRAIAGTLVEIGRGKHNVSWLANVLAAHDRTQAGQTAPAHGLSLLWVKY